VRKHLIFLALFVLIALPGCSASPPVQQVTQVDPCDVDADVARLTAKAVEHLIGNPRAPLDTTKPILVATVADIDNLKASSTLGRLITEQVAASLSQNGYNIPEVRLSNTLLVDEEGEFMLSRELRKLALRSQDAQAVVTGTYAAGACEVNVILKIVRLSDSKIVGTASYEFPNGPNTQSLLSALR
jgi:FlgO protein